MERIGRPLSGGFETFLRTKDLLRSSQTSESDKNWKEIELSPQEIIELKQNLRDKPELFKEAVDRLFKEIDQVKVELDEALGIETARFPYDDIRSTNFYRNLVESIILPGDEWASDNPLASPELLAIMVGKLQVIGGQSG